MDVEIESRVERLNRMISESRIIRNEWTGTDEQGREVACLLAALSPEAAKAETASACPAAVMPAWFAHLTPWMDDHSSAAEWPRVIRRYAACANQWHTLDDAAWRRVEVATRRAAVVEAMRHTSDEQALDSCRQVLVWLDADMPELSHAAVQAAVRAVRAARAMSKAEAATTKAALAAAWAAEAGTTTKAALAAAWAAWTATAAAMWAAKSAAAETATVKLAATEAAEAAEYEAADRIVDAILSALEKECLAVR